MQMTLRDLSTGKLMEMSYFCYSKGRQKRGARVTTEHLRGPRSRVLMMGGGHGNKKG